MYLTYLMFQPFNFCKYAHYEILITGYYLLKMTIDYQYFKITR